MESGCNGEEAARIGRMLAICVIGYGVHLGQHSEQVLAST